DDFFSSLSRATASSAASVSAAAETWPLLAHSLSLLAMNCRPAGVSFLSCRQACSSAAVMNASVFVLNSSIASARTFPCPRGVHPGPRGPGQIYRMIRIRENHERLHSHHPTGLFLQKRTRCSRLVVVRPLGRYSEAC